MGLYILEFGTSQGYIINFITLGKNMRLSLFKLFFTLLMVAKKFIRCSALTSLIFIEYMALHERHTTTI